jgi:hypothetical protein
MARGRVVDFGSYRFFSMLRRADNAGKRIDKTDPRWSVYIKEHAINEVAATAIVKHKFESPIPVLIDEGRDTDGLYFYSKTEETCIRLIAID